MADTTDDRLRLVEDRLLVIETILPTLATKSDLADLRADMHGELGTLRTEVERVANRLTLTVVTLAGLLAGFIYFVVKII